MAIALDSTSAPTNGAGSSSLNRSHTCSGSDRILWVGVATASGASVPVTGVTYNSVAMTKVTSIVPQSNWDLSLWYLAAPATGTNTITATCGSAPAHAFRIMSASYTGASQTGIPDSSNSATGVTTSRTVSTTTVADNCWVVGLGMTGASAIVPSTGMTTRSETDSASSSTVLADSNGPKTPAGSYSMTFTTANDSTGLIVASFAPATAAATNSNFLMLL